MNEDDFEQMAAPLAELDPDRVERAARMAFKVANVAQKVGMIATVAAAGGLGLAAFLRVKRDRDEAYEAAYRHADRAGAAEAEVYRLRGELLKAQVPALADVSEPSEG